MKSALIGLVLVFGFEGALEAQSAAGIVARIGLRAEPSDGSSPTALLKAEGSNAGEDGSREWSVSVPWQGELDLDPRSTWKLHVELEGYWAPEVILEPGTISAVTFLLVPTGFVTGGLAVPRSESVPAEVSVRIEPPPGNDETTVPRTVLRCPVESDCWTCEVPAGELDLRLEAEEFVPHYFWGARIAPHRTTDLGVLQLERGASLAGWIETTQTPPESSSPAVAELEPQVLGWGGDPRERRRISSRSQRAEVNERGFFQIRGIAPGEYVLKASKPGFAPRHVFPVTIEEHRESLLDSPVSLSPPATLEVYLEPASDPQGKPWIVSLRRKQPRSNLFTTITDGDLSEEGSWSKEGLADGEYSLAIKDHSDSEWLDRRLEVSSGMPPFFIEIPVIPVEGHITLGDEPLETILAFGGVNASPSIRLISDEDGRFEGYLPREGLWTVDLVPQDQKFLEQVVEPVEVRKKPGQSRARVRISLPNTRLTGVVVEKGEPVPEAILLILRDEGKRRREVSLQVDEKGEFELLGLTPGALHLHAYARGRSSDWTRIDLLEDLEPPRVRLVLEEEIELSGQVFASSGVVPGAQVVAIPAGGDMSLSETTVTAADGAFLLNVPAHSTAVDIFIIPPGFTMHFERVSLATGRPEPRLISLEPGGGTLSMAGESFSDDSARFLLHQGTVVHLKTLMGLLFPIGAVSVGSDVSFLHMPPGNYSLCRGRGYSVERCTDGYLAPHGELLLRSTDSDAAGSNVDTTPSKQ